MNKLKTYGFDATILLIFGLLHFYTWSIRNGLTHYKPIREIALGESVSESSRMGVKIFFENLRNETLFIFVGILIVSVIFAFSNRSSKLVRYGLIGICCCSLLLHLSIFLT